jgi:tetratricopeptide (TPR) repeat protein
MDLTTAESVVALILGVLSSGLYEAIISSSNKLKNYLNEEKDIGDFLEIKEEVFEEIIWEKLTLEDFNEIGGIEQIRDFFDLGVTEDIMKKLYLFDFVGNNNYEDKEYIRNEFCQLFLRHFEIKNNTNAVSIVLLKLFDVFDDCCQKFLDTAIWKEESLPAHEILSKRRFREVYERLEKVLAEIKLLKQMGSLDHRQKEAENQELMSCYNSSELPKYPKKLKKFVTENRADELRKALTYLENHRILLINGVGGVGKSTFARALVELRPSNVPKPFWFSFYKNQDAKLGDILEKLAAYMNAPEIASFKDKKRGLGNSDVYRLTGELNRKNEVWLVFDDLSMVLEDQRFIDKGIEFLFSSLRDNTHNAKVIITSRILPILENRESLIDEDDDDEKQHLNGLSKDFAVDYLASNGLEKVEKPNLEKLATGVDGHPLALKLLIKLVKKHGAANILGDLSIYQTEKEDTIKKARNLFNKLAGNEIELLERISVYRGSVEWKGLKEMFTKNTPKNAIDKLIDKSLLEIDNNGNYWLHPLVQEFSYGDLKNKKEAHLVAFNYYKSLNLPENPTKKEDLQPAIEAHYHACEAGKYSLAVDIIWKFRIYNLLDIWGNSRTLIEIYEKLLSKDHFNGKPLFKNKMNYGAVLGYLGLAYSDLGDIKKAIDKYDQALKIDREIDDRRGESNHLGYMGNAYCDLGDVKKAIDNYEQALEIAREIDDKWGEGNHLGNLGLAYCDLGDAKGAIDYYKQALKIEKGIIKKGIGDRRGEGADLGNLGSAYLDLGDAKKAIDYYGQALKIAREIGDRRRESNHLGNLGSAYLDLGDAKKAIDYYEEALKITREIDDRRGEGAALGNLGLAYSALGDAKKAIEYYEQDLKIAREIGDRRGEGAALGNMWNAYSDLGDDKKAIEYYEQALKIAREIGDRRREGNHLGNLGSAYLDLGDAKKAIDYYVQALKIAREIGDKRGEGNHLGNLGSAYLDLGDAKKAIEYCEQALKIAREIGDKRGEGNHLGNLGSAYLDLGDAKKAIEYYEQALKIAREIGDRRREGNHLGNLGLTHLDLGDDKKAIEFLKESLAIGKSIEDPRIINFCEKKLKNIEIFIK